MANAARRWKTASVLPVCGLLVFFVCYRLLPGKNAPVVTAKTARHFDLGPCRLKGYDPTFKRPVVTAYVPLEYPVEAAARGLQGDVALDVDYLESGKIRVKRVVFGLGHGLDEEAARAVKQIKFKPATSHGRPVTFSEIYVVPFHLPGADPSACYYSYWPGNPGRAHCTSWKPE